MVDCVYVVKSCRQRWVVAVNVDLDLAAAISQCLSSQCQLSWDAVEVRMRRLLHLSLVQRAAFQQIICSKRES